MLNWSHISGRSRLWLLFALYSNFVAALNIAIPENLKNQLAINVVNLSSDAAIYHYRESVPLLVASNMKIVTSYVALKSLGANFRWCTKLSYTGKIVDGVLTGNVYLTGGGDPTLNTNEVKDLLTTLQRLQVRRINGNLIIDNHIFNNTVTISQLFPEPLAAYEVVPNGLMMDSGLSAVNINIDNQEIKLNSLRSGDYRLISKLQLDSIESGGNCNDRVSVVTAANKQLIFTGSIPKSCDGATLNLNLLPVEQYDAVVLKQVLKELNIVLKGDVKIAITDSSAQLLNKIASPPLAAVMKTMNKKSNNLYAETLFLSLGAYMTDNNNTYLDSLQYYQKIVKQQFGFSELAIENGAGMSRHERLTTSEVTRLLTTLYMSSESALFIDSLPTPEDDDILEHNFAQFYPRLFMKTGALYDVKAYSGYYISNHQIPYAISFIINGSNHGQLSESQLTEFYNIMADTLKQLD